MHYIRFFATVAAALTLAACGGGGGSPGAQVSSGTSTTPSNTATASPTIVVSIVNPAGAEVSNIAVGGGYSARATVKNAAGVPQTDKLVTFTLTGASIATLSPESALTNAQGVAQVSIAPQSLSVVGAATLAATAIVGTTTVTASKDFGVSAANLALSAITVGSSSLSSGGNTSLSVTALLGGAPSATTPVNVTFAASCGRINSGGTSVSTTTNGSGVASATYTAVNADGSLCSGAVSITASSAGATPQSATINVAAPAANAVTFVSASPAQIFVAGSGAVEQSVVRFKVLSGSTPMANEQVVFSLQTNPGGVGLNTAGSTANVTGTTNSQGEASVSVFSGTIPGPVKVRAALFSNPTIFSESQNFTVSSGPPSQRFMSLSVQTFNIEGWNVDGTSTRLTARIADRQGNPVEDGTVVNFTAEGGQVASSCATAKVNGISSCSVDFISQNPRPTGARASVLAFTNGTKDYVDVNGNNRYDSGDTLTDIGDPYRDDNENAAFDTGEFVITRGGTSTCAGAGGAFPARANTCDNLLATTVRQQTVIMFSSSTPVLAAESVTTGLITFTLQSADNTLLPMPAGTLVAATATDTTGGASCTVDTISPSTVPNVSPGTDPTASRATTHSIILKDCAAGDIVSINITAPSGLRTTFVRTLP